MENKLKVLSETKPFGTDSLKIHLRLSQISTEQWKEMHNVPLTASKLEQICGLMIVGIFVDELKICWLLAIYHSVSQPSKGWRAPDNNMAGKLSYFEEKLFWAWNGETP